MNYNYPIAPNEPSRILALAEYDLDYLAMKEDFSGLAQLAATVTGMAMSHINLIDAFSQWTIGDYGLPGGLSSREDTVCHYTITQDDHFEVEDLSKDERFMEKGFVKSEPLLRYYYGVPLKSKGLNIGSICVFDPEVKNLSRDKGELLNIIGMEVIRRLQTRKTINTLTQKYEALRTSHKNLAHDIRGPVGGVMGLAQMIQDQGEDNSMEEVLEFSELMQKSCNSILDLADEILSDFEPEVKANGVSELSLAALGEKLSELYLAQAKNKNIRFKVSVDEENKNIPVTKSKLVQIAGNLICNAMKFTPEGGNVSVDLFVSTSNQRFLNIVVKDSGIGLHPEKIDEIMSGRIMSTRGTTGEHGFGFGLGLVKQLIDALKGSLQISSVYGEGTTFEVVLPLKSEHHSV